VLQCRFVTLHTSSDVLLRPTSVTVSPGPGAARDHSDVIGVPVQTYIATCRGSTVEYCTLKVSVSQPDARAFHCRGQQCGRCEGKEAPSGYTWKQGIEPQFERGGEYEMNVCLCFAVPHQHGVLRLRVEEDIPATVRKIMLSKNSRKPEPKRQDLELILE
jgi:hypothetical protein